MMSPLGRRPAAGFLLLFAIACGDPHRDLPGDGGISHLFDAGLPPAPLAPQLEPVPAVTPYGILTVRGRAAASRVVVEGITNPLVTSVLPSGEFCIDVPLGGPGLYSFSAFALGADGQLSPSTPTMSLERDPSAQRIPGARTCAGVDPAGCPEPIEICGNGRDDDCNNLVDEQDPVCNPCPDDLFEPNDDPASPRIEPARYSDLVICPGDPDYFGVFARAGDVIHARIEFRHAEGNLDLHLLGRNGRTVLARSTTLTDDELVTVTASTSGDYRVLVVAETAVQNDYTLELRVTPSGN